jgi:UDP-N-acetylmuramoyl-L-alanyl-D-glutamate--2,6-diaminopimelate ligase
VIPVVDVLSRLQYHGLMAQPVPRTDLAVSGVSDDSRQVRPGDLYCAIRGYVHDGHRFLEDAAEAGAAAALVEIPEASLDLPQFQVADSRRAAAIAAQVVLGDPSAGLRLIGVTGTNGKTTTVHVIRHVLSRFGACGSLGTLGSITASGSRIASDLTTPGPVEFARRLADLRDGGVECVVAEVSSHALAQARVDGVAFDVGVFTNLSRDHLDYHAGFDEYRNTKLRLVDLVRSGGTLVVNADEPAWSGIGEGKRVVRFGLEGMAEYRARKVELRATGSNWILSGPQGETAVELPLLGEFNVANALAAAAVAGESGMDLRAIAEALASTPPVLGRLEVLSQEPLVLRDYAHTPDALRRALLALRPLVRGRLICLFGCGGDRDRGKRPQMGRAAAEGADLVIVTSDNPRTEPPEAIIAEILPGLEGVEFEPEVNRRSAIARALDLAEPGDAVLLAGKGHEDYQIVGTERRPFDEAVVVRELLAGSGGESR